MWSGFLLVNKMITSFSDSYNIDFSAYDSLGALDPILGIDTRLFIDPLLVKNTKIPEFQSASNKIEKYFESILRLLKASKKKMIYFGIKHFKLLNLVKLMDSQLVMVKTMRAAGELGK